MSVTRFGAIVLNNEHVSFRGKKNNILRNHLMALFTTHTSKKTQERLVQII